MRGSRRRVGGYVLPVLLLVGGMLAFPMPVSLQTLPAVLVGAGDIAACGNPGDEATAELLDRVEGTVFTLGDNVYDSGTAREFARCYDPTWGRHKERTRPAPGNHEYDTANAAGYFGYFGAAAGDPGRGYYSYDLGDWHIVVINSNCGPVGGCQAGSPQEQWLRDDLATHLTNCTLAYWHHPRFSSGPHGNAVEMQPIWQALYDLGADVALSGHDHDYERFAPQDPAGRSDPERGIRQFVVGTGGRGHRPFDRVQPNSEIRNSDTFGVLRLTLLPTSYTWDFIAEAGKTFADSGSGSCHAAPEDVPAEPLGLTGSWLTAGASKLRHSTLGAGGPMPRSQRADSGVRYASARYGRKSLRRSG